MSTRGSGADAILGVRAVIAGYAQALDDGRTDDVVSFFWADGAATIPGLGTVRGHAALREAYARLSPREPQVHLVTNTSVKALDESEVHATSDFVLVTHDGDGWGVRVVGRYDDLASKDIEQDQWLFRHRTMTLTAPAET